MSLPDWEKARRKAWRDIEDSMVPAEPPGKVSEKWYRNGSKWMLNRCARQIRSHHERIHVRWITDNVPLCDDDCLVRDLES